MGGLRDACESIELALSRRIEIGSGMLVASERKIATAGSKIARRHMSTKGKSEDTGKISTNVDVICDHLFRSSGVADVEDEEITAENRTLR